MPSFGARLCQSGTEASSNAASGYLATRPHACVSYHVYKHSRDMIYMLIIQVSSRWSVGRHPLLWIFMLVMLVYKRIEASHLVVAPAPPIRKGGNQGEKSGECDSA